MLPAFEETLSQFADQAAIGEVVKQLGLEASIDNIGKISVLAQQYFNEVKVRQDVVARWPTTVFNYSKSGQELVLLLAQMHKVSLQASVQQILDLNEEQSVAMLKSPAFDQVFAAFVENNKGHAPLLREKLDTALTVGAARVREIMRGRAVGAYARAAWQLKEGQAANHAIDLEALDIALRDVELPDDLKPEFRDLLSEVESGISEILKLQSTAEWSEVRYAFERIRNGFKETADPRVRRNETPLERARSERLRKADAQWVAMGQLWKIEQNEQPLCRLPANAR